MASLAPTPVDLNHFDHADSAPQFLFRATAAVSAGLLLGAAIDIASRKAQGANANKEFQLRSKPNAAVFFAFQTFLNIAVLLCIIRIFPRFTEFFQLSICGALFGILLFCVQRNLADNALAVTNV